MPLLCAIESLPIYDPSKVSKLHEMLKKTFIIASHSLTSVAELAFDSWQKKILQEKCYPKKKNCP